MWRILSVLFLSLYAYLFLSFSPPLFLSSSLALALSLFFLSHLIRHMMLLLRMAALLATDKVPTFQI